MIKEFSLTLPLDLERSYQLVRTSGDQIISWGAHRVNPEEHYLEWKQSFWALTGSTLISVTLEPVSEDETKVTAIIHKPMQLIDPVGICYRVFRKLEKSIEKNISKSDV